MPSGATKSYFYVNIYFLNFAKIVMNTLVQAKKNPQIFKKTKKQKKNYDRLKRIKNESSREKVAAGHSGLE